MAKNTPSIAKNQMRRALLAILDPPPSKAETAELWSFFESQCAYCGLALNRASRNGHHDHVVSQSVGGTNSIFNQVLSCSRCNGDEKREEQWESFLRRKANSQLLYESRRSKIEAWLSRPNDRSIAPAQRAAAETIIKEALELFDGAVQKMRALRSTDI